MYQELYIAADVPPCHDAMGGIPAFVGERLAVPVRVAEVICQVARDHQIQTGVLMRSACGRGREKNARARWDAMTRLRHMRWGARRPTVTQIADWLRCDHSTVSHGLRRWQEINHVI